MNESGRHLFIVVSIALGMLLLLSFFPWSRMTNNRIKDFSLFSELDTTRHLSNTLSDIPIDPELEEFMDETDEAANEILPTEPSDTMVLPPEEEPVVSPTYQEAPMEDGKVLIESYGTESFPNLKRALASGRARIAVLGDSYIEGDIFTQNLRSQLQEAYGGSGVGYMNMHSDFPGFRKTVRQSDSGWEAHDIRTMSSKDSIRLINNEYYIAQGPAQSIYKATRYLPGNESWDRSSFVFLSHDSTSVKLTTSSGTETFCIEPSPLPQILTTDGKTDVFKVEIGGSGLIGLGVYLDSQSGVQVDCMSVRGNSGIAQRKTNKLLTSAIRGTIDYDLIILEYGTNVLSAEQTDYSSYSVAMTKVIENLRNCYPNADILLLGIGDRGIKNGTDMISMPSCSAMIKAQREAARRTGSHFWDTRQAMGGDGAVIDWNKRHLINSDFVHINHTGGKVLANLFMESFRHALQ